MAKKRLRKQKLSKAAAAAAAAAATSKKAKKTKLKKPKKNPKRKYQSDSDSETDSLQALLNPYPKDQLIKLVTDLAVTSPALSATLHEAAETDVCHRKLFVHGIGWDVTRQTMFNVFQPFGEIEELSLVTDKHTGKPKGYAFVTYKTRRDASKALKEPKKMIGNRMASCQLASLGHNPVPQDGGGAGSKSASVTGRKIYVANVPENVNGERLRAFFVKFGEVECGPIGGFDLNTGKCRGYAFFVYKTVEGAKKCLEEPDKVFEGITLHCKLALEGKSKVGGAAGITTAVMPVGAPPPPIMPVMPMPQAHMLAAMAAAQAHQNMAMFSGQGNPNMGFLNPFYGQLLAGANMGTMNPVMMSPMGLGQMAGVGGGMIGNHAIGSLAGGTSGVAMLGSHGSSSFGSSGPSGGEVEKHGNKGGGGVAESQAMVNLGSIVGYNGMLGNHKLSSIGGDAAAAGAGRAVGSLGGAGRLGNKEGNSLISGTFNGSGGVTGGTTSGSMVQGLQQAYPAPQIGQNQSATKTLNNSGYSSYS